MRVSRRGGSAARSLLEVVDDLSLSQFATPGAFGTNRPIVLSGQIDSPASFLVVAAGTTRTVAADGHAVYRMQPGAGATTSLSYGLAWPLKRPWGLVAASGRVRRVWTYDCVVKRTLPLTASGLLFFGICDDPATSFLVSSGGIALQSVDTENAGRWTARYRVPPGAATSLLDTGIAPDGTYQHLRMRYYDNENPRAEAYINGALVATFSGATLPGFETGEPYNPGIVATAQVGAGQIDDVLYTRHAVEVSN